VERGLFEMYRSDPERADALLIGRRHWLRGAGGAALVPLLGRWLPFAAALPVGMVPAALAQGVGAGRLLVLDGKAKLVVLSDRPLVAEPAEHMLDDDITPTDKLFIRNNGEPPPPTPDPDGWELTIDGAVQTPLRLSLAELRRRFAPMSLPMQLECGGNGRSLFVPETKGVPWGSGAIGVPEWTGVRLRDVLAAAGPLPEAVYTGHFSADRPVSGDPRPMVLSRGIPLAKAMDPHTLLAWAINGEPLPPIHGFPLRLVVPGYPGSASQKWLTRIWVRDREHDGEGMTGTNFRLPRQPMVPGARPDERNFAVLESMPVRSIITSPANGSALPTGTRTLALRGHAWAAERQVTAVDVTIDFGQSWVRADLFPPPNPFAWQRWHANVPLPGPGYFEAWVRATDNSGRAQPFQAANWNPQGYGGNAMHRIAVTVEGAGP